MDEIIVRPKYSRQPSTPRNKRRQPENDLMSTVFAAKLLVVVVFLSVFALCKAANTPATNFIISKVKLITTEHFDTNKYVVNVATALGIKLPENNAFKQNNENSSILDSELGGDIATINQNDNKINKENENSTSQGQTSTINPADTSTSAGDDAAVSDNIKALNQVPVVEEKDIKSLADKYSFIIPIKGEIESSFGIRTDPLSGTTKFHSGIDIAANMGTSIKAALAGEVVDAGSSPEYDSYVKIKHNDGIYTIYAHCSLLVAKVGQKVNQGDVVAKVGDTEGLSGAYLHFEVWKDDKAVDPEKLLNLQNQ